MFSESNEDLAYLSSSRPSGPAQRSTSPDEADISTLKRVLQVVDDQISTYSLVSSLDLSESNLLVKQQAAVNQRVEAHLKELQLLIKTAIEQAEEV